MHLKKTAAFLFTFAIHAKFSFSAHSKKLLDSRNESQALRETQVELENNFNHSAAFKKWLHTTLESYDSRLRPNFGDRPLKIRLGLSLIGVSSISEQDMSFSVEMFFHESWIDDRLCFDEGAFGTADPVTLPLNAPKALWIPDTSFLNALSSKVPEAGSVSHLHSMMLYHNGTIGYSRRLSVTAQCAMDLTMYPFDTQACRLELSSYGMTTKDVVYHWMRKEIPVGNISLADFDATYSLVKVINKTYAAGPFSVPIFCIEFTRRSGFCFLQLIVPSTAVVISSWISLWLDNEIQFTDLVTVILAIIFLSYSYNTVMPKVSYVKAMDIYLGACFFFVFLSLVKLAIVKYMHQVVHKRKEKHGAKMAARAASRSSIVIEEGPTGTLSATVGGSTDDSENAIEETPLTEPLVCNEEQDDAVPVSPSGAPAKRMESLKKKVSFGHQQMQSVVELQMNSHRDPELQNQTQGNQANNWTRASNLARTSTLKKRRLAMQAAIVERAVKMRLAVHEHMFHLPSIHDNYWRCMKTFHVTSQLVLPLAFGAFALFYFFIYPYVSNKGGVCE